MTLENLRAAIQLMGSDMTEDQKNKVLSSVKQHIGQDELDEIELVALTFDSPIYADLRQYRAEQGW